MLSYLAHLPSLIALLHILFPSTQSSSFIAHCYSLTHSLPFITYSPLIQSSSCFVHSLTYTPSSFTAIHPFFLHSFTHYNPSHSPSFTVVPFFFPHSLIAIPSHTLIVIPIPSFYPLLLPSLSSSLTLSIPRPSLLPSLTHRRVSVLITSVDEPLLLMLFLRAGRRRAGAGGAGGRAR